VGGGGTEWVMGDWPRRPKKKSGPMRPALVTVTRRGRVYRPPSAVLLGYTHQTGVLAVLHYILSGRRYAIVLDFDHDPVGARGDLHRL